MGLCSYCRLFISGFAQFSKFLADLTWEKSFSGDHCNKAVSSPEGSDDKVSDIVPELSASILNTPGCLRVRHWRSTTAAAGKNGTSISIRHLADDSDREDYSITEKECQALVWAVKKFRSFVWVYPIKIVTDHHALCWLTSKKESTGRLSRWALFLSEYKIVSVHKSGGLLSPGVIRRSPLYQI